MFTCLTWRVSYDSNDFRKRLMRDIRLSQGCCCRFKPCGMLSPVVERLVPDVSEDRNASISRILKTKALLAQQHWHIPHKLHLHDQLNRISSLNFLHFLRSTKPLTAPEFMSRRYTGCHAWCFTIFPSPFTQFQGSTSNIKILQPLYTFLTVLPIDNIQGCW